MFITTKTDTADNSAAMKMGFILRTYIEKIIQNKKYLYISA